jgi:osmotically-inducible protein OsmY
MKTEVCNKDDKRDMEITDTILSIFRWNWNTLNDTIKVKVVKGWVTLSGAVEWQYQKEAASAELDNFKGVKGITNNIKIQLKNTIKIDATALKIALENHFDLDSKNIRIVVFGSNIILEGSVDSCYQKGLAEHISWKTPGVTSITNELLLAED